MLLLCALPGLSDPNAPADLIKKMEAVVKKHFPDAIVTHKNGTFRAKHGTSTFMVHNVNMVGQVSEDAREEEGPNYKGFMIMIYVAEGKYRGAAVVPQTLRRPYWQTYIDRPPTADGKNHYVINFAYGVRLDSKFTQAVFGVLPRTSFPVSE
jgi:hypothetical protein